MKPSFPVIILGAGGHAKVLIDALRLQSVDILGIVDADPGKKGLEFMGLPIIGSDQDVTRYAPHCVRLVNGIGSVRCGAVRRKIFLGFKDKGYQFQHVIHPAAVVAADVLIAEGAQVMAGAIIQTGSEIGANAIINTRASVDHDCRIGSHVHIAPGAVLCGGVTIGEGAHIGTGAVIIQGITVGAAGLVAAGAVLVRNVQSGRMVAGVPAREFDK